MFRSWEEGLHEEVSGKDGCYGIIRVNSVLPKILEEKTNNVCDVLLYGCTFHKIFPRVSDSFSNTILTSVV